MIAGFILARKGKLDKWLTVRWAEPVPAEGKDVSEGDGDTEATETSEANPADETAATEAPDGEAVDPDTDTDTQ